MAIFRKRVIYEGWQYFDSFQEADDYICKMFAKKWLGCDSLGRIEDYIVACLNPKAKVMYYRIDKEGNQYKATYKIRVAK